MSDHTTEEQGPGLPHDDDLARLYRELPADQPSPEIDRVILEAARAARPRRGVVHRMRWVLPMAAAAGLVLMLTLTRLTPEQQSPQWIERDALREETTSADMRVNTKDAAETMSTGTAKSVRDAELAAKKKEVPTSAAQAAKAPNRVKLRERGDFVGVPPDAKSESESPSEQAWPFALEAGLGSEEACRRISEKLRVPCSFAEGRAELPVPAATMGDGGIWRGRVVTKVILHARSEVLIGVELELTTPQNQTERVHASSPP